MNIQRTNFLLPSRTLFNIIYSYIYNLKSLKLFPEKKDRMQTSHWASFIFHQFIVYACMNHECYVFQGQFNYVNIVIKPLDYESNAVTLQAKEGKKWLMLFVLLSACLVEYKQPCCPVLCFILTVAFTARRSESVKVRAFWCNVCPTCYHNFFFLW